jgi:predicted AlkP superfamily pyrophosphatase or phosphodiesterase
MRSGEKKRGATAETPPLRLVVLMVIDQLPAWSFARRVRLFKHGIRRLMANGVYYPEMRYPYANTVTAVGHATLVTGAPPAVTGIVANKWYRPKLGKYGSSVFDPDYVLLSRASPIPPNGRASRRTRAAERRREGAAEGRQKRRGVRPGVSPRWLRAETVGDRLKQETGGRGRVVTVSLKDRAAVLPGGKKADIAVFYSRRVKPLAMTTSTYYEKAVPSWLQRVNARLSISKKLRYVWRPLAPKLLRREAGPDAGAGEPRGYDLGAVFPHRLQKSAHPAKAIRETPFGDTMVLETALAALDGENLGRDGVVDFLSISFSAPDKIGHRWGQESWEMLDNLMRLDRKIGRLLQVLDQKVGKGRYAVVLTSDHGAPPTPGRLRTQGKVSFRVPLRAIERAARKAARRVAGKGRWILGVVHPFITLSRAARSLPPHKRARLLDGVVQAVRAVKGMQYAYRTDEISGRCATRRGARQAFCLSVHPALAGDVIFGAQAHCFPSGDRYEVVSHGSPHRYDQQVPLLIYAPHRRSKTVRKQVSALSVAPTLARLLSISPPQNAKAPAL